MLKYDEKVLRPWVLATPELNSWWHHFKDELKAENKPDKFGQVAMKRVFYTVVLGDDDYRRQYEELYNIQYREYDPDLVVELKKLLARFGWQRFFIALTSITWRLGQSIDEDTINRRRLEKSLDILRQIPDTVELPKQF